VGLRPSAVLPAQSSTVNDIAGQPIPSGRQPEIEAAVTPGMPAIPSTIARCAAVAAALVGYSDVGLMIGRPMRNVRVDVLSNPRSMAISL